MKKDNFKYKFIFNILNNNLLKLLLGLLVICVVVIIEYKLDSILRHWLG